MGVVDHTPTMDAHPLGCTRLVNEMEDIGSSAREHHLEIRDGGRLQDPCARP